jgi:iron complex outermembrane recepter protein
VRRVRHCHWFLLLVAGVCGLTATGSPVAFDIPSEPANEALLAFSRQAKIDVLFSFDDLRKTESAGLQGEFEPGDALARLLRGTGFESRQTGDGKFIITPEAHPTGSLKGRLVDPSGTGIHAARVMLPLARQAVTTDASGTFDFPSVPPGTYELIATAAGFDPLRVAAVGIDRNHVLALEPRTLQPSADPSRLAPFIVEGESAKARPIDHSEAPLGPRIAAGNLDLARTEAGALPFTIYSRTQISRSGVVNLNEFLQRELLDSNASMLPPEQSGSTDSFIAGSTNLALRGYEPDSTVVLVNGRRMPEILTAFTSRDQPPDVNFIPLSLVQQVEVLPVSASALYGGNAVGGVINIVLRPEADAQATEVTTTYTNSLGGYDASQSSLSLLHTESLLHGALRVRVNATFTRATPPIERELGYLERRIHSATPLDEAVFGATPNIHTFRPTIVPEAPGPASSNPAAFTPPTDSLQPSAPNLGLAALPGLFGPGSSPVTSVAPGADGSAALAGFAAREGVRNTAFFKSPGGFASAPNTVDYLYGRRQQRSVYYGSAVYDVTPWLQLGFDGTYATTTINRGYDVLSADLTLRAASPLNPFRQDVDVSLNETPRALGENYSTGRIEYGSAVAGAVVTLPRQWKLSVDGQYAHNLVKFRGLAGASLDRWQNLVDRGIYNPLRDTQVFAAPQEFYDQVLIYRGAKDRFVTLGNYDTLDLAARLTQESIHLPTGTGIINLGADYRRNHLASLTDDVRFADGTLARDPLRISGRTLRRYSFFGELQAPLVPRRWLGARIERADTDLALRYLAADRAGERTFAPTAGLKLDFVDGLTLRGSVSASSRVPTPLLWRPLIAAGAGDGTVSSANLQPIYDPIRKQSYLVDQQEIVNLGLRAESALTQTAGIMFRRGKIHRFRVALDFVDTRKVNEIVTLNPAEIVELEALWPDRVTRAPLAPGDTHAVGKVTSVITSTINLASRHSQNWNTLLDYAWTECAGGTLELYGRLMTFTRFDRQVLPHSPVINELQFPDTGTGVLRYRANFGTAWSNREFGSGIDGHYFHSRVLPMSEWDAQGHDRIRPFWQFDAFLQHDIARWLPWDASRHTLRLQARVNNVLGAPFPKFINDPSGAGVQPYGDWRGRVYSLSLTATF